MTRIESARNGFVRESVSEFTVLRVLLGVATHLLRMSLASLFAQHRLASSLPLNASELADAVRAVMPDAGGPALHHDHNIYREALGREPLELIRNQGALSQRAR